MPLFRDLCLFDLALGSFCSLIVFLTSGFAGSVVSVCLSLTAFLRSFFGLFFMSVFDCYIFAGGKSAESSVAHTGSTSKVRPKTGLIDPIHKAICTFWRGPAKNLTNFEPNRAGGPRAAQPTHSIGPLADEKCTIEQP